MNTELFIARRLLSDKENRHHLSQSIVRIAVFGISLGLAVMITTISIVTAFKDEIRNKVIGFGSHFQILNFDSNLSYETQPISKNQPFLSSLKSLPDVQHIQVFALKPGIIKTKTDIQGIILKGVDKDFSADFFNKHLVEGKIFQPGDSSSRNDIVISKEIAKLLNLKLGDPLFMYFVQDPPRMRRFSITGIYETSLTEFDKLYALVNIQHIQQLNNWDSTQISGIEIFARNFESMGQLYQDIRDKMGYGVKEDGDNLQLVGITEKYPQIFDWLNLFDMNVTIIIVLMVLVAGINMVSGLLVLILERTHMIGILKALGTENFKLRKLFLYLSGFLILRGLVWGNILGLGICALQYFTGIIQLDPSAYFISSVPIHFNWFYYLLLNVGTLVCVLVILLFPSMVIAKISPIKTIRFN